MEILIPITFFLSMAAIFVLRGPLGKALGERLSGRSAAADGDVRQLRTELDEVRSELASLQERVDFAERLLARFREGRTIGPGA